MNIGVSNILLRGKLFLFIGIALLAIVMLPSTGNAGNGTFKNGKFDFCVSVRFNATAAQLAQIQTAFQNASQVLADATDGQHRFGTVTIVNNSGASQSAEYWINPGSGRAYATIGKYGIRGEHVNLYFAVDIAGAFSTSWSDCIEFGPVGQDGLAYRIAHEHAHHAYGVLDEYSGPFLGVIPFPVDAECAAPPDTATLNFCLMDSWGCRGGRGFGGVYTLNEFCVASNHDPDGDTFQHRRNKGMSCWQTIMAHPRRGATLTSDLPVDTPPAGHTVTFEQGFGGLRVMLVIDRSGSMSIEQRLDLAKQGANLFINLLQTGDSLGVASFASSPEVNFPLTTITGDGNKAAAKAAIASLIASGATNIGGGLQTALNQITAQADRSCNEIIVLLTDGDHNTGTPPESVIPALQDRGVTVLTVGVGAGISASGQASLQNIASQTGGKFFRVFDSLSLVATYFQLLLESRVKTNGLLTRAPLAISSGQVKEIPVSIETGAESAIFGVAIADPADGITLSLRSPSGVVITEIDAITDPNIDFFAEPNSKVFQILAPEPGIWNIIVSAGTVVTGNLEVFASVEQDGVQLNASVTKDMLMFPEAVEVQATPTFGGESVVGATVMGTVTRPDGTKVAITLFDDGLTAHADAVLGDGIYSASFNNYKGDGVYTFDLTVVNFNGMTSAGEYLFSFVPPNTKPVPPFTRSATTTAIVTGVPDIIFDTCLQDDSNGHRLQITSTTGEYMWTNCNGFTLRGTGKVIVKGSLVTLQDFSTGRRLQAKIDKATKRGSASVQASSGSFTIMDRNITDNTCVCP